MESQSVNKVDSDFSIHASSLHSRRVTRVLVNGASFAVFELSGDIIKATAEPLGFFHRDTRYLSRFELRVAGAIPYYLNSYASQENAQLRINLSNPDLSFQGEEGQLPKNSIEIERNWIIAGAVLFHKVTLRNYARLPIEIPLDFLFEVDFADLFEVRGFKRVSRGQQFAPVVADGCVTFLYHGLDGIKRTTKLMFGPPIAAALTADRASFFFVLKPDDQIDLEVRIISECEESSVGNKTPERYNQALVQRRSEILRLDAEWARVSASHESLDLLLRRSTADLTAMIRFAP